MGVESLTDLKLRKVKPNAGKRLDIWDTRIPGFGVRISPAGTKTFVLMYRIHNRKRRVSIGRYPEIGLADARRIALEMRAQIARQEDPQTKGNSNTTSFHFNKAVESFVAIHCVRHNRENTRLETERLLKRNFVTKWHNSDIRKITRADVLIILDDIINEGKPSAANHALAAIRKFFNWCVERGLIEQSPCVAIRRPAKQVSRDRVLGNDELSKIWHGGAQLGYPFGRIVQLLILTGQRRGEVSGMRWQDIDFENQIWSIPAEMNKSNRPHTVPLTEMTIEILNEIPRLSDQFVFPARGLSSTTFSGFSKSKRQLDQLMTIDDWRLHDLRRTLATNLARLSVPPHVVERILNHSTGILGGVAGIYNRFEYLDEMRLALNQWATDLERITNDVVANQDK